MRVPVVVAVGLFVASSASAHETWLLPSTFDATPDISIQIEPSGGMDFPASGTSIQADRVAKAAYRFRGTEGRLTPSPSADGSLRLRHEFSKRGLATVWLELEPKDIELTDAEVAEYLDEIGASETTRAIWADRKGRTTWRETYTKHAKTFVAVGSPSRDRSWELPAGMSLEIVPLDDPLAARSGGELKIRLLAAAGPLGGAPVGLMIAGATERIFRTTDVKGEATFPLARAGKALFFAVRLRPVAGGSRWESDFTTTTFRILPAK